jgi:hypothetical protein
MINIDTVYQRVLAIANKEQRGYVTPLEFNLLANQAQLEIFEDYLVQLNQALALPGNESEYADIVKSLNERISVFKTRADLIKVGSFFLYPSDLYKLGTLWYASTSLLEDGVEIQEINEDELLDYYKSPLTTPNKSRPLYIRRAENIRIISNPSITGGVSCSYIKKPSKVEWGYIVVNEQALYNASASSNFELQASEEASLITKILGLAGIVIQKQDLVAIGQQA